MNEKQMHKSRFSEAVRDARGMAKSHGKDFCIGYSASEDRLFISEPNCIVASAVQATITPFGEIKESRYLNPIFCEV